MRFCSSLPRIEALFFSVEITNFWLGGSQQVIKQVPAASPLANSGLYRILSEKKRGSICAITDDLLSADSHHRLVNCGLERVY